MVDVQEVPMSTADEDVVKREKDDLIDHLDELLERYLLTLHEYQQQMQQLSKQLSSDCYDERMQAIRKVRISEHDDLTSDCPNFSIYKSDSSDESANSSEQDALEQDATKKEGSTTASESKGEAENEKSQSTPGKDDPNPASEETKEKAKTAQKSADPLKWFGILVPPALRTAQTTFVNTIEGPVPRLATIAKEMRMQEIEIGRVKKQIKKM